MENLPFILFMVALATVYIANARYAERNVREIQDLQEKVKELNYEYMSLKSELMQSSMESEVAKKVANQGLYPLQDKPFKIILNKKDYQ